MRIHGAALTFAKGQVAKKDKVLDDLNDMVRSTGNFDYKGNKAMFSMLIELEYNVSKARSCIQRKIDSY